jgi:hypothetical protein
MNMKKKTVILILAIIFLAGLTAGSYGLYMFFKKHDDLSRTKPDFELTAHNLLSEFETDEAAASVRYISKVLEVTGPVETIKIGTDSTITVTLKDPGASTGVICSFQGRDIGEINVKKGGIATIRGECSGILFDVLLNNCVLVGN